MHLFWLLLILVIMLIGLCGTLIPLLPDTPLIVAGAVLHHFLLAPRGVTWRAILALTLLMLVSLALDFVSGSLGARYFGATRWGALGGILGAVIGFFYGPVGLLAGPLAGVLVGELLGGRGLLPAGRSAWGTFLGSVAGMAGKFAIGVIMIAWFLIAALA